MSSCIFKSGPVSAAKAQKAGSWESRTDDSFWQRFQLSCWVFQINQPLWNTEQIIRTIPQSKIFCSGEKKKKKKSQILEQQHNRGSFLKGTRSWLWERSLSRQCLKPMACLHRHPSARAHTWCGFFQRNFSGSHELKKSFSPCPPSPTISSFVKYILFLSDAKNIDHFLSRKKKKNKNFLPQYLRLRSYGQHVLFETFSFALCRKEIIKNLVFS